MGIITYESLGVGRVVNAAAAQSRLGGSTISPGVAAAMAHAGAGFVPVGELHDRVGERLAALTGNEAACVSCGAAGGVLIAVAACMYGDNAGAGASARAAAPLRRRVVVWRGQENGFLIGADMAGAQVKVIDDVAALASGGVDDVACVLWFPGAYAQPDDEQVFADLRRVARDRGLRVVVDAADQVPPFANLWRYTREYGADLAIFSGGKGLRGPGSSGLVLGRAELVRAARSHSSPGHGVGRPAKVSKEELLGLLAAVEEAAQWDEAEIAAGWERTVAEWSAALAPLRSRGLTLTRVPTSHCGQPIPRLVVGLPGGRRDSVIEALWARSPRIAVLAHGDAAIALNPQMLADGEAEEVAEAVVEEIGASV